MSQWPSVVYCQSDEQFAIASAAKTVCRLRRCIPVHALASIIMDESPKGMLVLE